MRSEERGAEAQDDETTQRGRKREHYQWNMDIIGCKSVSAETELLFAVCEFFRSIGITSADVGIKVNSRKVMASVLDSYGISGATFAPVCIVMDKLDKIGPDAVKEELMTTKVSAVKVSTHPASMSSSVSSNSPNLTVLATGSSLTHPSSEA